MKLFCLVFQIAFHIYFMETGRYRTLKYKNNKKTSGMNG